MQISDLHFDKFPTPATFTYWKIGFETEVCICSQFPTVQCCGSKKWSWLIQWMILNHRALSEELLVQTLSYLTREMLSHRKNRPEYPLLDKVSVEEMKAHKEDRFLPRKTDCLPHLRVTSGSLDPRILSRTMPTYSLLLSK